MGVKTMLIIHPQWPPSNLVGTHRVRLIANELQDLGWAALVLTIDERDYEEPLASETLKLVSPNVEVIRVRARPVARVFGKRLVGDVSLRGWKALKRKASELMESREIAFTWFSLPPWYTSLMGYQLKKQFGTPFGIDYRDPWVYELAEHQKGLNRAQATLLSARILEPLALRGIGLISGVSEGYLQGVITRNKKARLAPKVTFQMGFSKRDHFIDLPDFEPSFDPGKRTFVYAGAHWALGAPLFTIWLQALAKLHKSKPLKGIEFLFIGTGNPELKSIQTQAEELGIQGVVREIPERISYLEVQKSLRKCEGALVIGSVEPHYSSSKLFQCLITTPRVFGFFHEESEGRGVLRECNADAFYVPYHPSKKISELHETLEKRISNFINPQATWEANLKPLEQYSTQNNAKHFIAAVERVIEDLKK